MENLPPCATPRRITCGYCGHSFRGVGRAAYCRLKGKACTQAAFRTLRRADSAEARPQDLLKAALIWSRRGKSDRATVYLEALERNL